MRRFALTAFVLAVAGANCHPAFAQTVSAPSDLKKFNVTIRRFDPAKGPLSGQEFVLPVDSPDEEHAAASTLANTVSFSKKMDGDKALPVAFMVVRVAPRP